MLLDPFAFILVFWLHDLISVLWIVASVSTPLPNVQSPAIAPNTKTSMLSKVEQYS